MLFQSYVKNGGQIIIYSEEQLRNLEATLERHGLKAEVEMSMPESGDIRFQYTVKKVEGFTSLISSRPFTARDLELEIPKSRSKIKENAARLGKNYASSFGTYFIGREGAHLILSALDGKFAEVDQIVESLFDWREHAEFAGFAGVMAGTEMATDLAMVRMLGPDKLPVLRNIVKHSLAMMVAMELTSLSREYLENPEALPMILDRHLSRENLIRVVGVTASFLISRPVIRYGIGGLRALRHGTKVTAVTPQGFLAKAGEEVLVFVAVGLAERYLLPRADRMMLSSSLEGQIEELQNKVKNGTLTKEDLLALEETYQYIVQHYMSDFIKERQEFMDSFEQDLKAGAKRDAKSIQLSQRRLQIMNENPRNMFDFNKFFLGEMALQKEPIEPDEQVRLKTQEMLRRIEGCAYRWEAYQKDVALPQITKTLETMSQADPELELYYFPENISETFSHQRVVLERLLEQAKEPKTRHMIEDAQKRREARKLMFGRTMSELLNPSEVSTSNFTKAVETR